MIVPVQKLKVTEELAAVLRGDAGDLVPGRYQKKGTGKTLQGFAVHEIGVGAGDGVEKIEVHRRDAEASSGGMAVIAVRVDLHLGAGD